MKKKIYENYFQETLQIKDLEIYHDLIEDLIENNQKVGRKYFNKKKEIKYEERFITDKIHTFTQISRNITFIFLPGTNKMNGVIAYRFYKKGPKIYHKKFFIFHFST